MISLFKVYLWSQVGLPFNSVDLDVLITSSSLVNLALHAVADSPEESDEHSQEADHDHNIGRDDPPIELMLCLHGHQVGPAAGQCKSHTGQEHTCHRPQLLLHIHDSLFEFQVAFF